MIRRNLDGFTYIEVMAALAIMLLLFSLINRMSAAVFQTQHQDQIKLQMLYFAQGELEEYQYDQVAQLTRQWPAMTPGDANLPAMTANLQLLSTKSPAGLQQFAVKATSPGYFAGESAVYVTGYLPFIASPQAGCTGTACSGEGTGGSGEGSGNGNGDGDGDQNGDGSNRND